MQAVATTTPAKADCGLALYEPNPFQAEFHSVRGERRRRWFCGGRQSGKTEAGAAESCLFASHLARGSIGAIFTPSYPHAVVARHRFESMLPFSMWSFHGGDRAWTVKGGSTVYLRSLSDADAPRGLTLDWAWLDECALYDPKAWDNLRPALAVRNAPCWGTSTPRGHNWLWRQAVSEPEEGVDYLIHTRSIDNPAFPDSEWEAVKKRYGVDSPLFRQEYEGRFEAFVGQAFPHFTRERHVGHVTANAWRALGCWDVGWTAPTVYLWAQISAEDHVVIRGCRTWTETERVVILPEVSQLPPVDEHWIPTDMTYGARQAADPGWNTEMRKRGWETKTRSTSAISESRRLGLIREWLHGDRLTIDVSGEGAEMVVSAFEHAELDANPEKDILRDLHPHTDIIDAVGQLFAGLWGSRPMTITVH